MTEIKSIAIADIHVPPRLREVEEDHALAIQASIVEHGLLNPVTVRRTPAKGKGMTPYTLVAGAHRLRAVELLGETEIDAVVVAADGDEAVLIEIVENLFRNDLSVLDRAQFVATYREVWERKYGQVKRGNPNWDKLSQLPKNNDLAGSGGKKTNLVQLLADEAAAGFSAHVADRLGVTPRTVRRLNTIAQKLHPDIRTAVRGTAVADNQSQLLKLARMAPNTQAGAAAAFAATGDIRLAFDAAALRPRVKPTLQQEIFGRLLSTWGRANAETKADFLRVIGAAIVGAEGAADAD